MGRNREKYNEYHRKYAAEHREQHRKACAKYRKTTMKDSTRNKIKEYQHWYYENVTKPKRDREALRWVED